MTAPVGVCERNDLRGLAPKREAPLLGPLEVA
jgi:hypothetical protein